MAGEITAILNRIDALLQDQDLTARRRLSTPLVKAHAATVDVMKQIAADAATPTVVAYLLGEGGSQGMKGFISSSTRVQRSFSVRLELVMYSGGMAANSPDYQALIRTLGETWQAVEALLGDPGNYDRGTTGWTDSRGFSGGPTLPMKDRINKRCGFIAHYDAALGAM